MSHHEFIWSLYLTLNNMLERPVLGITCFLVESWTKIFLGPENQLVWGNLAWMLNSQQAPRPYLKASISPFYIASCFPLFMILKCPQFTCRYGKKALIFWAKFQLGKATGTINYTSANCLKLSSSLWFDTLPSGPFLALKLIRKFFKKISFCLWHLLFHLLYTVLLPKDDDCHNNNKNSQQQQCV